ncbi:MAG: DUF2460 domain-containing protein [Magnetospirillum sp.]|nr:DUF2460 domain-containing protein [Magnetospirillum sp.]
MAIPSFPAFDGAGFPTRSPVWKTTVQEAVSGKDYAVSFWTYPRWRWQIPLNLLRAAFGYAEWQAMVGVFNECAGRGTPFHWTDPDDNAVTAQAMGVGDGVTTVFPFVRALGGYAEPIQDVVGASVQIEAGGVLQGAGTYTLLTDPQWGLVYAVQFTAAPAPGAPVSWSGSFNWACRFDADQADFTKFMMGRWKGQKISFTSIKVV